LVGVAKVAGLTAEQAQRDLEQRFASGGFLRDPHVNILVKEFATQGISVLGEVARPGIYPLLGSPRLFDALSAAGGVTNRAGKMVYVSHREHPSAGNAIFFSRDLKRGSHAKRVFAVRRYRYGLTRGNRLRQRRRKDAWRICHEQRRESDRSAGISPRAGVKSDVDKERVHNPPKRWQVAGNSYRTEADYDS